MCAKWRFFQTVTDKHTFSLRVKPDVVENGNEESDGNKKSEEVWAWVLEEGEKCSEAEKKCDEQRVHESQNNKISSQQLEREIQEPQERTVSRGVKPDVVENAKDREEGLKMEESEAKSVLKETQDEIDKAEKKCQLEREQKMNELNRLEAECNQKRLLLESKKNQVISEKSERQREIEELEQRRTSSKQDDEETNTERADRWRMEALKREESATKYDLEDAQVEIDKAEEKCKLERKKMNELIGRLEAEEKCQ